MLYGLLGRYSLRRIVNQKFCQYIFQIIRTAGWQEFLQSDTFFRRKIYLHVRRLLPESIKYLRFWCSDHIVNSMNLIQLVFPWKQMLFGYQLKKNTPKTPNVHFLIIIPISHQTLWGSVPPCRYIVRIGRWTMSALARP